MNGTVWNGIAILGVAIAVYCVSLQVSDIGRKLDRIIDFENLNEVVAE